MGSMTVLSYANSVMEDFKIHFQKKVEKGVLEELPTNQLSKCIIFLSVGNQSSRAHVYKEVASSYTEAIDGIHRRLVKLVQKFGVNPEWVKIDVVTNIDQLTFEELEQKMATTRKNYFRSGIAFDKEFKLAFLEQEINGNAMIRSVNKGPQALHERNINNYLNYNHANHFPFIQQRYRNKPIYIFDTISAFKDKKDTEIVDLHNGALKNGMREVEDIGEEARSLVEKSTYFLVDQVQEDGKFEYGYFSAFAKRIGTYNILRHSSSLYSMVEGYELIQDEKILDAVEKGIEYLIREVIVYKENVEEETAFVVDHANHNEIKLGSSATAILAMTKYMEVTKSDKYLQVAQALARGILQMKTVNGGFIHVFTYPTYEIKDIHRIIYYEGEAVLSLLRLYAIDKNELWLQEAKKTFDYFIENDHWKHHDHWLSYSANEITLYAPEDKYFIFGLKNCNNRLNFIYHRDTTYPTFLELIMAAYKLTDKIKELGKQHLLDEYLDEELLNETIEKRVDYQRVGFFYPELAMYMKSPELILDGFFVRHHSFRVRIDDVEHYISGYCQYLQYYFPKTLVK